MASLESVIDGKLRLFISGVQAQVLAAGSAGEERLTAPSRSLLDALLARLGIGDVTIVDKTSILLDTPEAERIGLPDVSLYDRASRLILCVELKAPGKGADPRAFTTAHDKRQWENYKNLPNLIYTDGNHWTLWHTGTQSTHSLHICDDIASAKPQVHIDSETAAKFFTEALGWTSPKIKNARKLASECAKYCRMLRAQVQALPDGVLDHISQDWRDLLFPDLEKDKFVDAYTQTVTFALLTASSLGIRFDLGLDATKCDRLNLHLYHIGSELEKRRGVLGKSLSLLTGSSQVRDRLHTYLEVILTLVGSVEWDTIRSSGASTAWLHFYEDFLAEYDNTLRRQSGSYYTPAEIVEWMTRFADTLLVERLDTDGGFADDRVTVVDPATGTGTFLLGVLDRIAERVAATTGPGAVGGRTAAAARSRLIGFEIQSGPYAVAQLRLAEKLRSLDPDVQLDDNLRVHLTDTLADPAVPSQEVPLFFEALSKSREAANEVKKSEPVVVVIGNPPYLDGAGGRGGWVEKHLLDDWRPPVDWGVSPQLRNLSNLYVFFWRWATWKVFQDSPLPDPKRNGTSDAGGNDQSGADQSGIVSFITTTGFLSGDGFQKMRKWLREWSSDIWVLHLGPEGHEAPIGTQIFQAMRQPVAIVTAVRNADKALDVPANVSYHQVRPGDRESKMAAIARITGPDSVEWQAVQHRESEHWRAPFIPSAGGRWDEMVRVEDLFPWDGNGMMVGRTWPISPDEASLTKRWKKLISESDPEEQDKLLVKHDRDRRVDKPIEDNLTAEVPFSRALQNETDSDLKFQNYGFRSFDRQHIIRDKRVINQPNPSLWKAHSDDAQIYLVVGDFNTDSTRPILASSEGAVVSFSEAIPDVHYLAGSRGGRVHPLWRNNEGDEGNTSMDLLRCVAEQLEREEVSPLEIMAYVAAVAAHPGYTREFRPQLWNATEVRLPLTASDDLFEKAVGVGKKVLALHTFRTRCSDAELDAPSSMAMNTSPMPKIATHLSYADSSNTLRIHGETDGAEVVGEIDSVTPEVKDFCVANMNVIESWFGYRRHMPAGRNRSELDKINPEYWQEEYTDDLLKLVRNLSEVTSLHRVQESILSEVLDGELITPNVLESEGALPIPEALREAPEPFQAGKQLFNVNDSSSGQ